MDPKLYEATANERSNFDFNNNISEITCGQGNTVLHIAAKCDNKCAAERILRARPSLAHEPNAKGDTPLHVAARADSLHVAALLSEHYEADSRPVAMLEAGGANPFHAVNRAKDTALHEAVKCGGFDFVKMLLEKERGLAGFRNAAGESPAFLAVDRGFYAISLCILETFPRCSVFGRNGMTVMHAAVIRDEEPLVQKLLEICGPEILEISDDFSWMPLHYAAHLGNVGIVETILKTTSSLAYIKDNQGMCPLHIAARTGKSRVMKRLIEARPDICELLDSKGRTALHVAVENVQRKVIKTLLDMEQFDDLINEQDLEGNAALHVAAIKANFPILQILALENRVDKGVVNNMGMTAFDIFNESTVELTQMEKKFLSVFGRQCVTRSLKSAVATESSDEPPEETTSGEAPSPAHHTNQTTTTREPHVLNKKATPLTEHVKNMANINLVIATLVVGITFAAALQMPGGYNDDGFANLKGKPAFTMFLVFDSLAFGCAAGSLLTYFSSTIFSRIFPFLRPQHDATESVDIIVVMMFTALSVSFAATAFMYATNAVLYRIPAKFFSLWQLGLPAVAANISFSIPSVYLLYQVAPLLRLQFLTSLRRFR